MQVIMKQTLEHAGCIAVLMFVIVVAFIPEFKGTRFPMQVDAAMMQTPWEEARALGEHIPMDAFAREQVFRYYPWYKFISDSAQEGQFPAWYPLEGTGVPFAAAWRTRVFSPFTLPFYLFGFRTALALSLALKLLVAGLCAFYVARRFGLQPAPSLFVALSYALSGGIWVWGLFPLGDVAPWLPLLLLSLERLSFGHGWTWPGGALTLGLMLLGGEPGIVAAFVLWAGLFIAVRVLSQHESPHIGQSLLGFVLLGSVGIALAALQWFPYWEFIENGVMEAGFSQGDLPLFSVLSFMIPKAIGYVNYGVFLHVGVVAVTLIGLWLCVRAHLLPLQRTRLEGAALSAVIGLVIAVLFLSLSSVMVMLLVLSLMLAFMAAAALEEWAELDYDSMHAALEQAQKLLLPFSVCVLFFLLLGVLSGSARQFWYEVLISLVFFSATLGVIWMTISRPSVRLSGYALCLLCSLNLLWSLWGLAPHTTPERVFPETSVIEALRDRGERVAGTEKIANWPLAGNGIGQIYAPGGMRLNRYNSFMDQVAQYPELLARTGANPILADKAMLQGPLAPNRHTLEIESLLPIGLGYFHLPHKMATNRVVYFGDTLKKSQPEKLLPQSPVLLEGGALPDTDPLVEEPAEIGVLKRSANEIRLVVNSPRAGVLVLCEAWYPGWKAEVNGIERRVFPVDVAFRGVEVEEGKNKVTLYYDNMVFLIGLGISAIALGIVFLGYVYWWLYWRKIKATHPWELEMH